MKRRPRRAMAATVTAFVVLAVAVFVAVVAIQMLLDQQPWLDYDRVANTVHEQHWNGLAALITGAVAAFVGLVMLLTAVLPGRPTVVPLRGDPAGMTSGASWRSLRSTLRAAAAGVDGVQTAKLRMGRKRVTAVVRTNRTNPAGMDDAVRTAVEHRLDQIEPEARADVKVRVSAARSSS